MAFETAFESIPASRARVLCGVGKDGQQGTRGHNTGGGHTQDQGSPAPDETLALAEHVGLEPVVQVEADGIEALSQQASNVGGGGFSGAYAQDAPEVAGDLPLLGRGFVWRTAEDEAFSMGGHEGIPAGSRADVKALRADSAPGREMAGGAASQRRLDRPGQPRIQTREKPRLPLPCNTVYCAGVVSVMGRRISLLRKLCWTPCAMLVLNPTPTASANEDAKASCSKAFVAVQTLRKEGALVEAQEAAVACASQKCPRLLRRDCVVWQEEIGKAVPTVVVGVRDRRGRDVTDATIEVDGKAVPEALAGTPLPVDPGQRHFRVLRGKQVLSEETLLIRQGEKDRLVTLEVVFSEVPAPPEAVPAKATTRPVPAASLEDANPGSTRRTWGYVAGSVGLLSLGATTYFGWKATSKWSEREDHCGSGGCDAAAVDASDAAHRAARVADITLGIGLVGVALGAYLVLSSDGDEAAAVRAGVGATPTGPTGLWLQGRW